MSTETTEIKRYEADIEYDEATGDSFVDFEESPQGDWVRWEDVKHLIEMFAVYQDLKKEVPNDPPPP